MTGPTMRQLARLICLLAMAASSAVASAAGNGNEPKPSATAPVPASASASTAATTTSASGHITATPAASAAPASNASSASDPAAAPAAAGFAPAPRAPLPAPIVGTPAPTLAPSVSYLQTMLGLGFVLALLLVLAWLAKRFGPRPQHGNAQIKLVGALSLGGRERIMVVEVGDQWIVVGAAPGRVNALSTMPKQALPPGTPAGTPVSASFADWLKHTMDKRSNP